MAYFKLKGKATIDGSVQKPFEVVVESNDPNFSSYSSKMEGAVQNLYPSWKSIRVESWNKIS
ncbi:MAG: hypothetical protein HDR97_01410 [Bacteroides sp.]|nr:hypothetical protein [Bacteroides sp.]